MEKQNNAKTHKFDSVIRDLSWIKENPKYNDSIVLFEDGNAFHAYGGSARRVNKLLEHSRSLDKLSLPSGERIPHAVISFSDDYASYSILEELNGIYNKAVTTVDVNKDMDVDYLPKNKLYIPEKGLHERDPVFHDIIKKALSGNKEGVLSDAEGLSKAVEEPLRYVEKAGLGEPRNLYDYISSPWNWKLKVIAENSQYAVAASIFSEDEKKYDIENAKDLIVYGKYSEKEFLRAARKSQLSQDWSYIAYNDSTQLPVRIMLQNAFEKKYIKELRNMERSLADRLGEDFYYIADSKKGEDGIYVSRYSADEHEDYDEYIKTLSVRGNRVYVKKEYGDEKSLTDYLTDVLRKDACGDQHVKECYNYIASGIDKVLKEQKELSSTPYFYEVIGAEDIDEAYEKDKGVDSLGELRDDLGIRGGDIGQAPEYVSHYDAKYIETYMPGYVFDDSHPELAEPGTSRVFHRLSENSLKDIISGIISSGKVSVSDYHNLPDTIKKVFENCPGGKEFLGNYNRLKNKDSITLAEFNQSGCFDYNKEDLSKLSTADLNKMKGDFVNEIDYYKRELNGSDDPDYRHSIYEERDATSDHLCLINDILKERNEKESLSAIDIPDSQGRWHRGGEHMQDPGEEVPKEAVPMQEEASQTRVENISLSDQDEVSKENEQESQERERPRGLHL